MTPKQFTFFIFSIMLVSKLDLKAQCCVWYPRKDCDTLNTEIERQNCWLRLFATQQLNIKEDTINAFLDFRKGKNEVYLQGETTPWGGDYFQWDKGGITQRWQADAKNKVLKDTSIVQWNTILKMTEAEIYKLSPAEKLDIYLGNKDFRITKTEMIKRGALRQNASHNDGFCNGVRAAGALTPEPKKTITVTSKDNIKLKFFPADLKALAGAAYFHLYSDSCYGQIGCPSNFDANCNPNPAVFDLSLRLILGYGQKCIFIDTSQNSMIYNKTIFGYSRKITGMASSISSNTGESKTIDVTMTVYCLSDLTINESNSPTKPIIAKKENLTKYKKWFRVYTFKYTLDVNDKNEVTNGRWTSKAPDFLWFAVGQGGDNRQPKESLNANQYLDNNAIMELINLSAERNGSH